MPQIIWRTPMNSFWALFSIMMVTSIYLLWGFMKNRRPSLLLVITIAAAGLLFIVGMWFDPEQVKAILTP